MTAMPSSSVPPLVVRGPDCLPALIPHLVGFHPTVSLVVLGLVPGSRTVRVTLRVDLPPLDAPVLDVVDGWQTAIAALLRAGALEAVLAVYPGHAEDPWADDDPEPGLPRDLLVAAVADALKEAGVSPLDAVCVVGDRLRSYWCRDALCCPPRGHRVPEAEVLELCAALVGHGSAPFASRADLVATLQPRLDADPVRIAVTRAGTLRRARSTPADDVAAVDSCLARLGRWDPRDADSLPRLVADLSALCAEIRSRDLLLRALTVEADPDALAAARSVLVEAVRCAAGPDLAPVATVLAVCAWVGGDGACARVALEVALEADAAYSLAALVEAALDTGAPPWTWTEMMADLSVADILAADLRDPGDPDDPDLDDADDDAFDEAYDDVLDDPDDEVQV